MSYHSPIVVQSILAGVDKSAAEATPVCEALGPLDTLIRLIRRTTGAESVMVQFEGDMPQPIRLGRECLEVPLMRRGKRIGALRCFGTAFTPEADSLMQEFAALIVEQNDLSAQAHVDALTGALTRRAFADDMERLVSTYRRSGVACSLIMFDLDHFKKINDTYGHQAGDAVLRAVGRLVKRELRAEDRFGRLGGEEFGVLIAAGIETATEIGERLRQAIAAAVVDGFEEIRVTASLGVAGCDIEIDSATALMSVADQRLYSAKRTGRDKLCTGPSRTRAIPLC